MKLTIRGAIIKVLKSFGGPMSAEAIYLDIEKNNLYKFKTDQRLHVVKTRIRRDCEDLDFKSASRKKYFQLLSDGTYWLKGVDIPKGVGAQVRSTLSELNEELYEQHETYQSNFKKSLLATLIKLSPTEFELFCKNLIVAYGFINAEVTAATNDGGIDGFGNLKVGFTDLKVAFECKRWSKNTINYKVIRSFRGSIPDFCVYGIFFTTSNYTESAKKETEKEDRKPIVLFNGEDIVDFMIDNEFGVGLEKRISVWTNQVDLVLSEDDSDF